MIPKWHNLSIREVNKLLGTNVKQGLDEKEVKKRQQEFGLNKLPEKKPLSSIKIFAHQFRSPLIYILVIAGFLCLFLKEWADAVVISAAIFINIIVGFIQERKASNALKELKKVVRHQAEVLRQGNLKIIDNQELVSGDIIILKAGDKVPADARLIKTNNLQINEAALTGEWLPSDKGIQVLDKETPLADRENMIYMGTMIESGQARAVVTEIGIETEIGKIATLVEEIEEEKTPYQKKLARFAKIIGLIITIICLIILIEGVVRGKGLLEMFTVSIALAVAAIPEGLPVAMTVILALGMQRILKKQGLIRKLASAETLGSTSIICADKTATLTEGKMEVDQVIGNKILSLKTAALTSSAFIENLDDSKEKWIFRGSPTDKALLKTGISLIRTYKGKKIAEIPFNPINKWVAALYKEKGAHILYVSGAPEKILEFCNLTQKQKKELIEQLEKLTRKGLRVVGTAHKFLQITNSKELRIKKKMKNLKFTGFITLKDPLRKDAKKAIELCKRAGIRPIIVTGDHKLTAKAIAQEVGLKAKEENILEGKDLDKLSDEKFAEILDRIKIYARVEPRHKMRIVQAWQSREEVVAMTGDGVNDAPALKKADIGVALGSGTAVAKEASDLVLLNDSFSIIVAAVEEGRAIIDNIRKVITYLLSDAFCEVTLVGISILLGAPLPVTAAQILWVNLVEDGLPDIALAFEPKEKDLMKRKPESPKMPLLTSEMKALSFIIGGFVDDILLLILFFWLLKQNFALDYVRTMIFSTLAIDTIFASLCCKSLRRNLWQINIFSNKLLIIAIIFGIITLVAAVYLAPLQRLLKTVSLDFNDWLLIFSIGFIEIILIEVTKYYFIVKKKV